MSSYAAVDLGASSGRVLVGHLVAGRPPKVETSRFAYMPARVPAGSGEAGGGTLQWGVLRLWRGVLEGLRVGLLAQRGGHRADQRLDHGFRDATTRRWSGPAFAALSAATGADVAALLAPVVEPGRIAAATRRTGQRLPTDEANTVRCILDSLALGYRRAMRQASTLFGRAVDVVHIVGGGSRNALLCRLTADTVGLPVVAGPAEGTAMGNLLVQAWATGALPGGLPAIR